MTDKEKIELIIQDKHLNSTQFCNEVGIAQGTLSHIRSGRTEPSLNILRSISQAFPDINPAWLFYGEEPMYKKIDAPTPENKDGDGGHVNSSEVDEHPSDGSQLSFAFNSVPASFASPSSRGMSQKADAADASSPSSASPTLVSGSSRRSAAQMIQPTPMNVAEIVAETLKQQQRPQRKVVEVRIFFDDGTFETFGANG